MCRDTWDASLPHAKGSQLRGVRDRYLQRVASLRCLSRHTSALGSKPGAPLKTHTYGVDDWMAAAWSMSHAGGKNGRQVLGAPIFRFTTEAVRSVPSCGGDVRLLRAALRSHRVDDQLQHGPFNEVLGRPGSFGQRVRRRLGLEGRNWREPRARWNARWWLTGLCMGREGRTVEQVSRRRRSCRTARSRTGRSAERDGRSLNPAGHPCEPSRRWRTDGSRVR